MCSVHSRLCTSNSPVQRSAVEQDWMAQYHRQLKQDSRHSVRTSNSPAQRSAVEQDWMPEYHRQLKQDSTQAGGAPRRAPPSAPWLSRIGCRNTTGS